MASRACVLASSGLVVLGWWPAGEWYLGLGGPLHLLPLRVVVQDHLHPGLPKRSPGTTLGLLGGLFLKEMMKLHELQIGRLVPLAWLRPVDALLV
eukprot:SAG31_NODE_13574_length_860_cov_0.988173_1_plen_95_part_00